MRVKRLVSYLAALTAVAGIAISFSLSISNGIVSAREGSGYTTKSTGSMEDGDVLIELTPKMLNKDRLVLEFSINTHSVNLSQFDFSVLTTLEYEGRRFRPAKADRLRGHHSSGKIVFDTGWEAENFRVVIIGVPKVQERVYEW